MRDPRELRARYASLPSSVRMGHLGSDLLRLSRWVRARRDDGQVVDLLRQIAWLMEWNEEHASAELADMQREVCHWRRLWPMEAARSLLALRAQRMSHRILELSGLLEEART